MIGGRRDRIRMRLIRLVGGTVCQRLVTERGKEVFVGRIFAKGRNGSGFKIDERELNKTSSHE